MEILRRIINNTSSIFRYARTWYTTAEKALTFFLADAKGGLSTGDSRSLPLSFSNQPGCFFMNRGYAGPAFSEPRSVSPVWCISGVTKARDSAVPRRDAVSDLAHTNVFDEQVPQSGETTGSDTRSFGSFVVHVKAYRLTS